MTENVVSGGISVNEDSTLNFGNYLSKDKVKVNDFDVNGHLYSVKTHNEVTRLEQNGKLLLECVPGASLWNFKVSEDLITCVAKGTGVTGFTLELAPDTTYEFYVGFGKIGELKAGITGKASFSAELDEKGIDINIKKALS